MIWKIVLFHLANFSRNLGHVNNQGKHFVHLFPFIKKWKWQNAKTIFLFQIV